DGLYLLVGPCLVEFAASRGVGAGRAVGADDVGAGVGSTSDGVGEVVTTKQHAQLFGVGLEHCDEGQEGAELFGLGELGVAGINGDLDAVVVGVLEQLTEQVHIAGQRGDVEPVGL